MELGMIGDDCEALLRVLAIRQARCHVHGAHQLRIVVEAMRRVDTPWIAADFVVHVGPPADDLSRASNTDWGFLADLKNPVAKHRSALARTSGVSTGLTTAMRSKL